MSTKKKSPKFIYELQYHLPKNTYPDKEPEAGVYLFLNEKWHVDAWVNGGRIPISLASTYRSRERAGTKTPDENLIHDAPVNIGVFMQYGIKIIDCTFGSPSNINGVIVPAMKNVSIYEEDGLILSFSKRHGHNLAAKLGGKKACVRIKDVQFLKEIIDDQVNIIGKLAECRYTADHQRNHFLKSIFDSWQEEIRIFWAASSNVTVTLPPGIAELVEYY